MINLVLVLFLSTTLAESLHEGDSCVLKSGGPGVCTDLTNCGPVLENLKLGSTPDLVCGYSGFVPIVCCPRSTSVNTTPPPSLESEHESGVIARKKCAEYSQYGWALEAAPLLTLHPHFNNVSQCGIKTHVFFGNNRNAYRTELPFMAAIGYDSNTGYIGWHCGGTLISETFVLTAAQCAHSSEWGKAAWVRVGDFILMGPDKPTKPVDRRVTERIVYPEFKSSLQYHDIALLRLQSRVPFNARIKPACLHTAPLTGTQKAITTGWGRANDDGSRDLRIAILPLVDHETCNTNWTSRGVMPKLPNGVLEDLSICAAAEDAGTCQDDAGGALVIYSKQEYYCMYDVIGVTGYGKLCNGRNPGIYTRVYYYLKWIESTVWGEVH